MQHKNSSHQTIGQNKHIGYVSLNTGNLDQAIWFYHSIVGFLIIKRYEKSAILGTFENHPLLILTEIAHATKREKNETGLDHFAILVPNRKELSRHFRVVVDNNYPISMIADHMVNESFYIHDPDGNLIEFTRDLTAEELIIHSPLHSTELANILFTLNGPLQTHTVSPYTRIGHVLLRVTDLMESEKFYTKSIGFEVSMRMQGAVFVAAGDYHHHLGFHVWETLKGKAPSKSTVGLRYFTIQVPVYESFSKIREAFREADSEIKIEGQKISVHDPSGNGILVTSKYGDTSEEAIELEAFFQKGNKS
ncbi:VOC family protein [Paenibacillus sp. D2_2]|uniref:VOC family protein n=1 Tax=Paenibacillus sp. D2_2 TaxID=3073092 RepID=UPI002815DE94|nr:VOC family protein [Paenibacillus sp. D2_2]WMT40806.1 VOC family protein [Paenibacillus sp. D2_2]